MKTAFLLAIIFTLGLPTFAKDKKESTPTEKPKDAPAAKPKLTQEELEAKFKTTLTKATFSGRWCALKDGELGPEKEDKYTILGVR